MSRLPVILVAFSSLLVGCAADPINPSFPLTAEAAQAALRVMKEEPKPLARPVVVVGGYLDPGVFASPVSGSIRKAMQDDRVIYVTLFSCGNFDDCRRRVIDAVQKAYPSDDPNWTAEVDVVGISMGGLAARYAAAPVESADEGAPGKRLKIARLFTIGTPHQGAVLADLPTFIKLQAQMRKGSKFLTELEVLTANDAYPIIPYVRLHDELVGEGNAAPTGQIPHWLPNRAFESAHLFMSFDPRITADIVRRLRDEEPFAKGPPTPLPG